MTSTARPARRGALLAPGYRVLDLLSRGDRLDVYDAWSIERDSRCVLKTLRPDRADEGPARRALLLEGRLLQRLTHPHLVRAYDVTSTRDGRPVVVLETLGGETLSHLLHPETGRRRSLAPSDVAELGRQLCSVVGYLHHHGWLHRDVKPANIVAEAGRARLIDLSLVRRPSRARAGAGTADYMAPEQARGGPLTTAVDVWGIGAVLFAALAGRRAFDVPDDDDSYPQLETRAPRLAGMPEIPTAIASLVDQCLEPSPGDRPSVAELGTRLGTWLDDQEAGSAA